MAPLHSHNFEKLPKVLDREQIFLNHYSWLVGWALQLTRDSKDEAEDLVHELYVRFVNSKATPDSADEDRLRAYLHKSLRNLAISRAARKRRNALSSISLVEYESAEFALDSIDRNQLLLVRTDLAAICEYACIRRKTSRAASVLSLRFFLGYFPSEIMKIIQASRDAVDKLTRIAQREAKIYIRRPEVLHFPGSEPMCRPSFSSYLPDEPSALFLELRNRLFHEPEGACLGLEYMAEKYRGESKGSFSTQEIAHLSSCMTCLEQANHLLNLPNLHQRFPTDSIDPRDDDSPRSGSGSGSSNNGTPGHLKKLQQTNEHRPIELQLAADGEIQTTHQINSSHSNFQIVLKALAPPQFIEVLSEQEIGMLYLDLGDADISEPSPQHEAVSLSDGRRLEVEVAISGRDLVISVFYYDPLFDLPKETLPEEAASHLFDSPHELPSAIPLQNDAPGAWKRFASWVAKVRGRYGAGMGIVAGVAALGICLLLYAGKHRVNHSIPDAHQLLARSQQAAVLTPPQSATHRTFAVEVRSSAGTLLEAGKVDSLRTLAPRRSALKLVDDKGKLLAGRWLNSHGTVTDYTQQHGLTHPHPKVEQLPGFEDTWQHVPDAEDFQQIASKGGKLTARQTDANYEIDYAAPTSSDEARVVSARLVIAGNTMRPIAEALMVQSGKETREYSFHELTYAVIPANQVVDNDFSPPDQLIVFGPGSGSALPQIGGKAHLALQALQLLSNLGPEIEREVDLNRTPDGGLELNGVLSSAEEKESVLRVFRPIQSEGDLSLSLHSADEQPTSNPSTRTVSVESLDSISVDNARVPFDGELRALLATAGMAEPEIDKEIHRVASAATAQGAQLHRESWTIRQIAANDFSRSELQSMQPEDKMLWLTLLNKHLKSFGECLTSLTTTLQPLVSIEIGQSLPPRKTPANLNDISELTTAVETLNRNSESLDRLLTAGFTLSPGKVATAPKTDDVVQLLAEMQTRERSLQETVERLQTFGHD